LRYWSLTTYLDETGDLVDHEWAEPVIEEAGSGFYLMRVCHNSSWNQHQCIDEWLQYSDLREILYAAVVRAGVQVIFDTEVSFAKPPCHHDSELSDDPSPLPSCDRPTVHLSDGTILEADMIIGADGHWQCSTVRLSFQGDVVKPRKTGTIVLPGNVPMSRISGDDVLKNHGIACSWVYWLGPRRCFMGASSFLIGSRVLLTTF
jgi:salicylate hydroxylase